MSHGRPCSLLAVSACHGEKASFHTTRPLPPFPVIRLQKAALLVLHEEGPPLHSVLQGTAPEEGAVLVLGGSAGFSADDEATLERLGGKRASVGKLPLLASHCIVLAHAALDQAVG